MQTIENINEAASAPSRTEGANLADVLCAAIKEYGEACYDYGLANPMNPAQSVILYERKQKTWGKVSEILDGLKAHNK